MFDSRDLPPHNITPIRPDIELPMLPKKREYCAQWCRQVVVIEKTRMLECEHCKRVIDPFDYLWQWANEGGNRLSVYEDLNKQITQKREELERLKSVVSSERQKARKIGVPQRELDRIKYDVQFGKQA